MTLTLADVYQQSTYLLLVPYDLQILIQDYDEIDGLSLEYGNGEPFKDLPLNTPVEAMSDGTIVIDGDVFKAYVTQQIKFEPSKD